MSKYYVRMDILEDNSKNINDSSVKMEDDISELKKTIEGINWVGPSSELYNEMMNEELKKTNDISKLYGLFGKFMGSASSGFTDVNNNIEKGFEEIRNGGISGTFTGSTGISNATKCPKCGNKLINSICLQCGYK